MRSTNEIIIAVKEQKPVTEQELRYAVCALSAMEYFANSEIESCIKGLETEKPTLRSFILKQAQGFNERRFKSFRLPVDQYLGPGNIPGTTENNQRRNVAKTILKSATGIDLDSEEPTQPTQ